MADPTCSDDPLPALAAASVQMLPAAAPPADLLAGPGELELAHWPLPNPPGLDSGRAQPTTCQAFAGTLVLPCPVPASCEVVRRGAVLLVCPAHALPIQRS